jgi:membrane protein
LSAAPPKVRAGEPLQASLLPACLLPNRLASSRDSGSNMSDQAKPRANLWKEIYQRFSEDESTVMASSLAYFTIFSLAPLLVIVVTVAGLVWGADPVRGRIGEELKGVVGSPGVQQVDAMMIATSQHGHGLWATVAGIVVLLFGATGVVVQLQYSLNKIWRVEPDPRSGGVWQFVLQRVLSFGMILGMAFLLIVSLVVTAALATVGEQLSSWLPQGISKNVLLGLNFALSFVVYAILFAALFKWIPDAKSRIRDVALGALVTAVLFIVGKFLLGLYLGRQDASAYGPAAALVLILIWVYYSAIILFIGAEFTCVWAERNGRPSVPAAGAVRIQSRSDVERQARTAPPRSTV